MSPTRNHLIEQFLESARALGKAMWVGREQCFRQFKLHPAQVRVLYFIKHHQPVTIKQIAEVMKTTPSAATQLTDGIVKAGYIQRQRHASDRRKVSAVLSKKGEEKFAQFRKDHLKRMTELLSPLSDRELTQLITIQKKVTSA